MSVKVYNKPRTISVRGKEEELLLCDMLGVERIDLYTQDLSLSALQNVQLEDGLIRRANYEPLQYITGKAWFYGLQFFVEPGVFIPRPETEALVEAVSGYLGIRVSGYQVLDLCAGSGCIAICLAKFGKCGKIIAADISTKSIDIAKRNAVSNGVADKIEFRQADLFEGISGKFDIITCNPPYIKRKDLKILPREVSYEPQIALDGGEDGLDFYRRLASDAPEYLKDGGILAMELGDGQAEEVRRIFGSGEFIKDLNGIDRAMLWTK